MSLLHTWDLVRFQNNDLQGKQRRYKQIYNYLALGECIEEVLQGIQKIGGRFIKHETFKHDKDSGPFDQLHKVEAAMRLEGELECTIIITYENSNKHFDGKWVFQSLEILHQIDTTSFYDRGIHNESQAKL